MDRRDFILQAKANGSARTAAQLSGDFDALMLDPVLAPAPLPARDNAGIIESDKVSAWLEAMKAADPDRFRLLRLASFEDQKAAWVAAGRP